ncbi:tRNA (adenine(22)-N(1))-methyltransferase [Streptococcus fryi]
MDSITLSERLMQVSRFVPKGSRLLDVGSDHAYLPIYLCERDLVRSAIAGEVVEGPYQSALENVTRHGLEGRIAVRLANGLAAFDETDAIDTITICGMGGRLIADILDDGKSKLDKVSRLILQPNNREDDLRRWLQDNGFRLVTETILQENDKIYEIFVVEHGHMSLSEKELRFGPYLVEQSTPIFMVKWQRELSKLTWALDQIPQEHVDQRQVVEVKIKQIKEVLHES